MPSQKVNRSFKLLPLYLFSFIWLSLIMGATLLAATGKDVGSEKKMYKVSFQVWVNGDLISSPRVVTMEHRPSVIETRDDNEDGVKFVVLAYDQVRSDSGKEGVFLDIDFHYNRNGQKVHVRPQLIVLPGKEASILSSKDTFNYEIKALVQRQ